MAVSVANDLAVIDGTSHDLAEGLGWILELSGDSYAYCFVIAQRN